MTVQPTRNGERSGTALSDLRSLAIVAAIATAPVARAQEPAAARTTAAGIYSSEQADRGQAVFDAKCQSCHGAAFEGGTLAPALKGSEFLTPFQGKPLRRIYSRIISTMPPDDIGSLTESETLTLVALVLRANGYSAGPDALARADDLNSIVVGPPPEKQDQGTGNAEAAEIAENNPLQNHSLRARRSLRSGSVR
jgi:mono/diheme cytochrome c family protein